jgi:EAL domain-containing protein (putative c-di-GMP-specific phosphodiesterase class I)/FixJ family two-component response regulator
MQNTLLLVDDEPNILRALERVFQDEGYHILTATSGEEGLNLLTRFSVQVIISDQRMPNMTGSEFLTQVKKHYPKIIRIILSGYSDFEAIKEAINEGAIYKFLVKPWDDDLLRKEIHDAFLINTDQKEKEQNLIRLMNHAKLSGFSLKPNNDLLISENEILNAIETEQFIIYYQPIVKAQTGQLYGAEALLRWQHPKHGFLNPKDFIPLCEEMDLIIPVDTWVLHKACQQLKEWQTQGHADLSISINLSASFFNKPDLYKLVKEVLLTTQIPPDSLKLEITESLIMQNIESNIVILQQLSNLSVKISLDDFGTGYSSLSYLKNFPINTLKIDKSFIDNIVIDRNSAEIVAAIIGLAKILNLSVIAEGVETEDQLNILKEKHCDYIQGFFFSKPVPKQEFELLLNKHYPN